MVPDTISCVVLVVAGLCVLFLLDTYLYIRKIAKHLDRIALYLGRIEHAIKGR